MSSRQKLLDRALAVPSDFTWEEATVLLKHFGFEPLGAGKTGGSRRRFIHKPTMLVVRLHEPHPKPVLCKPALKQLIEYLKENNFISDEGGNDGR